MVAYKHAQLLPGEQRQQQLPETSPSLAFTLRLGDLRLLLSYGFQGLDDVALRGRWTGECNVGLSGFDWPQIRNIHWSDCGCKVRKEVRQPDSRA